MPSELVLVVRREMLNTDPSADSASATRAALVELREMLRVCLQVVLGG